MAFLSALADRIDRVSDAIGNAVKWLAVLLVLLQFVVVGLRYVYGTSFIWMQESVVYTHATLFMLAIAYTLLQDSHVRVDIFYAGWRPATRAWVDLVGVFVTILPFCFLLIWASWSYVLNSWRIGEGPLAVGGLPLTPALKTLIPVMAALLALQGLSVAIRALDVITGRSRTAFPFKPVQSDPV